MYFGTDDADATSLWYVPFSGGAALRLTDDVPAADSYPPLMSPQETICLITPDDLTVVYEVATTDGYELYSVAITGGPSVRLDHGPAAGLYIRNTELTPDGRYVVYSVGDPSIYSSTTVVHTYGLYAVSVHGGTAWLLSNPLAADQYIRSYEIAPDGTVVYWAGNQDAGYDLYAAPIPEPASLGLLALAGAAVLGRRRRPYGIRAGS